MYIKKKIENYHDENKNVLELKIQINKTVLLNLSKKHLNILYN